MNATLDLATHIHRLGHVVTPHLSARMIADKAELNAIIDRLAAERIDQAFVVGGDADEPGKFKDALELLRAMEDLGHHFRQVGVTGYPEGHPFISGDLLRQALIDKQRYATYIATQMCFDPAAIFAWVRGTRIDGVGLPIRVGIPGVVDPLRLASIATRIGVGTSARFVLKNRRAIWRLLRPKTYRPTKMVRALEPRSKELNLVGPPRLHLQPDRTHRRVGHGEQRTMTMVQSIDRAFAVLGALAVAPAGITELAGRVELPKSTVARLISTLEQLGAVVRTADGGLSHRACLGGAGRRRRTRPPA